jgi:hypothetical protein
VDVKSGTDAALQVSVNSLVDEYVEKDVDDESFVT